MVHSTSSEMYTAASMNYWPCSRSWGMPWNRAWMQRRVWEYTSQLKVTYRDGPLGGQGRRWFSGQGPLPGDRVPDIACVRADGGGPTTLHAELGSRWALVLPGPMVSDECTAVVAKRLGDDGAITLIAGHDADGEVLLVRPDAHLGWRGHPDPDALDRWLTAMTRHGRAS